MLRLEFQKLSLLLSKIRPNRRCYNLTKKEYDVLAKSIKRVLKKAIKAGGTSISDFKNLDGGVGYFSQKLKIYGLDECGICGGSGIPEGFCSCDGDVVDACGECGGDGSSCSSEPNLGCFLSK